MTSWPLTQLGSDPRGNLRTIDRCNNTIGRRPAAAHRGQSGGGYESFNLSVAIAANLKRPHQMFSCCSVRYTPDILLRWIWRRSRRSSSSAGFGDAPTLVLLRRVWRCSGACCSVSFTEPMWCEHRGSIMVLSSAA